MHASVRLDGAFRYPKVVYNEERLQIEWFLSPVFDKNKSLLKTPDEFDLRKSMITFNILEYQCRLLRKKYKSLEIIISSGKKENADFLSEEYLILTGIKFNFEFEIRENKNQLFLLFVEPYVNYAYKQGHNMLAELNYNLNNCEDKDRILTLWEEKIEKLLSETKKYATSKKEIIRLIHNTSDPDKENVKHIKE